MRRLITILSLSLTVGGVATRCPGSPFEFVVIGDTRPRFESEDFRVFEGIIPRINEVQPALAINLGDLIYGYGMRKEKQWNRYLEAIKSFSVPYYQIPGNHDAFSKDARRVYARHFGKLYQSFNDHGCHFVLLDTSEESRWGYLGRSQLAWLKADLRDNRLRPVFVFMHFPLWEAERIRPEYHACWRDVLHPLFLETGVRAVFGGHFHCYGPSRELDGIRYFVTGGGGAELLPDYRKSGGEHHFVRVRVNGDDLDVRVATSRGELSDAEADVMGGYLFADRHSSRIGIPKGAGDLRDGLACSIALENPYRDWLAGTVTWQVDPASFSVQPSGSPIGIPAGGTANLEFTLTAKTNVVKLQSLPWLEFEVASGGRRHRFHREVVFTENLRAPFYAGAAEPDGDLSDWAAVPIVVLGAAPNARIEVQAQHTREALRLAITAPIRTTEAAEEEEAFPDDLVVGIAGRLNQTEFSRDLLRVGFTQQGRATQVRDRTPGQRPETPMPGVRAASHVEGNRRAFELVVPHKLLAGIRSAGKNHLVVSVSAPVEPIAAALGENGAPPRNSFAYQVRYGGDTLIPVYFIDVLLEPRR